MLFDSLEGLDRNSRKYRNLEIAFQQDVYSFRCITMRVSSLTVLVNILLMFFTYTFRILFPLQWHLQLIFYLLFLFICQFVYTNLVCNT